MSDYRLSTMDGRAINLEEGLDIKSRLVYHMTVDIKSFSVRIERIIIGLYKVRLHSDIESCSLTHFDVNVT